MELREKLTNFAYFIKMTFIVIVKVSEILLKLHLIGNLISYAGIEGIFKG